MDRKIFIHKVIHKCERWRFSQPKGKEEMNMPQAAAFAFLAAFCLLDGELVKPHLEAS